VGYISEIHDYAESSRLAELQKLAAEFQILLSESKRPLQIQNCDAFLLARDDFEGHSSF
jgi:hypothetical protein